MVYYDYENTDDNLKISETNKSREDRALSHRKSGSILSINRIPSNSEGSNGDIAIGLVHKGVRLFVKIIGKWYSFTPDDTNSFENVMQNYKKKEYAITNLSLDRDYNANSASNDVLSDVLGTLIKDLSDLGILKLK